MAISVYVFKEENYYKQIYKIIKENDNKSIIIVTTNKPADMILNEINEEKIKTQNLFFIDTISKYIGKKELPENDNVVYIDDPANLTEIGIVTKLGIEKITGEKVLIFDSLTTLSLYNSSKNVVRFYNFFFQLARVNDIETIIIALESDIDKEALNSIHGLVDQVKTYDR
jgi:KaiC/GvpD/RAD55 family RecA-like ATPase